MTGSKDNSDDSAYGGSGDGFAGSSDGGSGDRLSLAGAPARVAPRPPEVGAPGWGGEEPHRGAGGGHAGLIVGDGEAAVIDTCWDHRQAARLLAACAPQLGPAAITTVVNTHSNGDHWWGNALMPPQAEIITSRASLAEMGREKPRELAALVRSLGVGRRLPGELGRDAAYLHAHLAPFDFRHVERRLPTTTFTGQRRLEVGGRVVELIEVGPAHTEGDLVVHVPDAGRGDGDDGDATRSGDVSVGGSGAREAGGGVVFAGDVLFVGLTPVMWAGPAANWVSALDKVEALRAAVVVPGHGPIGGPEEVSLQRDYWEWLASGVAEAHRRGLSALDATRSLLEGAAADDLAWSRWDSPERTYISVANEYRSLDGRPAPRSARDMLGAFRGLVRTRRLLTAGPGREGSTR